MHQKDTSLSIHQIEHVFVQYICEISAMEQRTFEVLEKIQAEMLCIKTMLSTVIRRQASERDEENERALPEDIVFPLATVDDMKALERKLTDVDTTKSVVSTCAVFSYNYR